MNQSQPTTKRLAYGLASLCFILILTMSEAKAAVVAYWRLEPGNLGADSSGNAHELTVTGLASSTDLAANAPGSGSATFNGSAFAKTTSPLDLSSYTHLTIEWLMKTAQSDLGIVYEHSANYNNSRGGLLADINEVAAGRLSVGNSGQPGYAVKDTPYPPDGGWHHYAVTIDSALTTDQRVKVYIDGVLATNLTQNALIGNPQSFINATFNLGSRNGSAFFFKGGLDEFRISDRILTPDQFTVPKAPVVAYWRFEPNNLGADSSGSGYDLTITGVASSTETASNAPGTASALFDGSSFAQTLATLNLSNYPGITIEWFMKTDQQDLGLIYEHSANYNAARGGLLADISENAIGQLSIGNSGQPGYWIKNTDLSPDSAWHHYAVTIDSRLNSTNRLKVYIDGTQPSSYAANFSQPANPMPFLNETFNIGSRNGGSLFFNGQLDEFRISGGILAPAQFLSPVSYSNAVLTITEQPADVTVTKTTLGSFTVGINISNAPASAVTYQWQQQNPGSSIWQDIAGADGPAFLTQPSPANGTKYRVVIGVVGNPATVISRPATLTLDAGQTISTVAYWRFEPNNLGADSSGNGHELAITGVTSSTDIPPNAPGTGSAHFDGASFAQTLATLNLSIYGGITLEWFMKTDQQDVGLIYEHSANYNSARGGLLADISENAIGQLSIGNSGQPGYWIKNTDLAPDGAWHHYAVTIDSRLNSTNRIKVYIDGTPPSSYAANFSQPANPRPFLDDIFNLGSRNGANLFFNGQMDEFRISGGILGLAQFLSPVSYSNAVVTITQQPADVNVTDNSLASFAVQASLTGAPASAITYQWQQQNAGSTNWEDILDAEGPAYRILTSPLASSGTKYRVIVAVLGGPASVTSREAALIVTPAGGQSQRVTITGVQVFDAETMTVNNRGDQALSIDGQVKTFSYMTPGGTAAPQIVAFDLWGSNKVNRIRVSKDGNTDGLGGLPNMNLTILFTTDSGDLNTRVYQPVADLVNGFSGSELITAEAVNADGTVLREHHDFSAEGFYSLTFKEVTATALAIRFERDSGDPRPWTHYPIHEFEAYAGAGAGPGPSLQATVSGGNLIISWAASATGFILQKTDQLPAGAWSTVAIAPIVEGGLNKVTQPLSGTAGFYRLSK